MLLKRSKILVFLVVTFSILGAAIFNYSFSEPALDSPFHIRGERHLRNIKMLTNGGENAEAYLSFNEKKLIYQATTGDLKCDQIFTMDFNGGGKRLVFASNRFNKKKRETNIFTAEWID